jgi:uncharacterized protein DUF1629
MDYWILKFANSGAVLSGFPRSKIKEWRYGKGERLAKEFPKNATVKFGDKFKDRRELFDFVHNMERTLFVSSKVRGILEKLDTPDLEFLPVSILDHKGAVAANDYFILNPIGTQDIIDMKKSDLVMDSLAEDEILTINKLVLQSKGIPKSAHLFRATNMPTLFLIDDTLRAAFKKEGVTGYQVFKAEGWDGLDIGAGDDADEA